MNDEMKAQQDIQRLSALVRAQQITIDKLEQAIAAPTAQEPTIEDKSQDWAGMDGATAWHLIDRHADGWADVAKMMGEWLAANTPPAAPVPLTDEQARDMPDCWVVIKDGRIIATHDEPCHHDGIQAVRYAPAAQPAPVQPVWIQPDHLQKAQKAPFLCRVEPHKRDDFVPLHPTPPAQPAVPDAIHHTDLSEHPQYIEGWNDCRAEMLKGMKP